MSAVAETVAAVREDLAARDGVLVAFSGGVDSSVVAALAHDALGDDAVACTAKSETLPAAELDDAVRVAEEIGIRHELVEFSELDSEAFVENDEQRCYHCRSMRLGAMYDRARELGIDVVCDKPSMACLSSRIPTGLDVTEERLSRVEKAERLLRTWGFEQFRVRDHDGLARIEVGEDELAAALDPDFVRAARDHIGDCGFDHVTLDLHGYRTGSVSPGEADQREASETANGEAVSPEDEEQGEDVVSDVFGQDYPSAE